MHRPTLNSLLLAAILLMLSACVPVSAKGPTASGAYSYATTAGDNLGIFMTIANPTALDDTLVGAQTAVAESTELHTVVKDAQGGMKMQPAGDVPVPAAGSVELKPGSLHIMLFGLNKDLNAGDTYTVTLEFANAGEKTVQVQVKQKN